MTVRALRQVIRHSDSVQIFNCRLLTFSEAAQNKQLLCLKVCFTCTISQMNRKLKHLICNPTCQLQCFQIHQFILHIHVVMSPLSYVIQANQMSLLPVESICNRMRVPHGVWGHLTPVTTPCWSCCSNLIKLATLLCHYSLQACGDFIFFTIKCRLLLLLHPPPRMLIIPFLFWQTENDSDWNFFWRWILPCKVT